MKGRPTDFTLELADKMCAMIAEGISVRTICLRDEMPSMQSFFTWLRIYPDFLEQYERAKEQSAYADDEKLDETGDMAIQEAKEVDPKAASAVVNAWKLKADNLKWAMSKKKPKKYGDKIDHTTGGEPFTLNLISYADASKQEPEEIN